MDVLNGIKLSESHAEIVYLKVVHVPESRLRTTGPLSPRSLGKLEDRMG